MKEIPSPPDQPPTERQPRQVNEVRASGEPEYTRIACAIAESLDTVIEPAKQGEMVLPIGEEVTLALDPSDNRIQLDTPSLNLTLRNVRAPQPLHGGVLFEIDEPDEQVKLLLDREGHIVLSRIPLEPDATPAARSANNARPHQHLRVPESTPLSPSQTPEAPVTKEKVKSERHVGELGRISTHTTKTGKLVAEVALAVPDPERPGQKLFVKFAAFDELAETLRDNYRPGDLVTAIGVPHELTRTNNRGHHWTERQLYFVRPPKRHDQEG